MNPSSTASPIANSAILYDFLLQQLAAESYLEGDVLSDAGSEEG